jgi:hypothetical protein
MARLRALGATGRIYTMRMDRFPLRHRGQGDGDNNRKRICGNMNFEGFAMVLLTPRFSGVPEAIQNHRTASEVYPLLNHHPPLQPPAFDFLSLQFNLFTKIQITLTLMLRFKSLIINNVADSVTP